MAPHITRPKALAAAAFGLWLGVIALQFGSLMGDASKPGRPATAPAYWPERAGFHRAPEQATLVLFFHPRCPCSRASLSELSEIMARSRGRLDSWALFDWPSEEAPGDLKTELWRRAQQIPGVHVLADRDGRDARLFDAHTSGQALLYDASGRLVFKGGITASRGGYGQNAGADAILALTAGVVPKRSLTPVFGCSLQAKAE